MTSLGAGATDALAQDGGPRNQIHYPLADDQAGLLEAARKAAQDGRLEQAVELYRSVLDSDGNERKGYHLGTLTERKGDQPRRFVGITEAAIAGLRALPPAGQKLFRGRYDYRAESALQQALRAPEPLSALARTYELYPISSHATRLLEVMGDLALERGDLGRALRAYDELLTHHGAEVAAPSRLRRKMLVCAVGLGLPERTRQLVLELRRDDPKAAIHLSGAPVGVDELIARALRREALQAGNSDDVPPSVHEPRGDSANRAFYDSAVSPGPARFGAKAYSDVGPFGPRVGGRLVPGSLQQAGATARSLPLVHEGEVFAFSADGFAAFELTSGEQRRRIVRPRSRPLFRDRNSKVQFGGVIDRGTLVTPLVEEVLEDEVYRGIPIKVQIPLRKLIAFDLRSWGWEWDHAQLLDGTKMERWSFPCPPAAEEGVIYAPSFSIEGFVNCNVSAFSSRTGKPLWSTWLSSGQVEQTMFGEHATEPLCVPLALDQGVVYWSTSFGSVAALDVDTGRPLWVTEYDQIEVKAPRGYYADPREIQWENNAPIVEAGVVVVAPMDSDYFYGYEAATGRRLWKEHRRRGAFGAESDMRYLLAAGAGKVVLGGGHDVLCRDAQTGKLLWREGLGGRVVAGRGLIARDSVLVPVDNNNLLVLDLETGRRTGAYDLATTGNLLLAGGNLVVVGDTALAVHKASGRANDRVRPASPDRGGRGDAPKRGERSFK